VIVGRKLTAAGRGYETNHGNIGHARERRSGRTVPRLSRQLCLAVMVWKFILATIPRVLVVVSVVVLVDPPRWETCSVVMMMMMIITYYRMAIVG
jgi:hypothetical protein